MLADTLTSLLAIVALLAAKYYGWIWMDPLMGIVGAILITKWSIGLLNQSGSLLLDLPGPDPLVGRVRKCLESLSGRPEIVDLHVWAIGPDIYSAAVTVVADAGNNTALF